MQLLRNCMTHAVDLPSAVLTLRLAANRAPDDRELHRMMALALSYARYLPYLTYSKELLPLEAFSKQGKEDREGVACHLAFVSRSCSYLLEA
jgi:hypothetical protein